MTCNELPALASAQFTVCGDNLALPSHHPEEEELGKTFTATPDIRSEKKCFWYTLFMLSKTEKKNPLYKSSFKQYIYIKLVCVHARLLQLSQFIKAVFIHRSRTIRDVPSVVWNVTGDPISLFTFNGIFFPMGLSVLTVHASTQREFLIWPDSLFFGTVTEIKTQVTTRLTV